MGCDMVVALSRATLDGGTFFAHNCNQLDEENLALLRLPGRIFAPGESVQTGTLLLPQARQTWTVLASRRPGQWGYPHGLNEHGVSIGLTSIRTRRREAGSGLTGPDLVRLGLERATSARQAVEVVTDLASRHGQGTADAANDPAFLLADGREAFVIEMFGPHWAVQHVNEVRAVSDLCHLRQDWDRLSHGLADLAIAQGWWPADGSKLDFAGVVAPEGGNAPSLRRWGRATLLLEQSNGQIDLALLRRLLSDHFEDSASLPALCRHAETPSAMRTVSSLIAQCGPDGSPPIAWYCFGSPCASVYFPLFLDGELPASFRAPRQANRFREPAQHAVPRTILIGLQERFERETQEFLAEARELRQRGESNRLPRLAELFMQHNLECWENVCLEFAPAPPRANRVPAESEFHSSGAWS
jgi:secernin